MMILLIAAVGFVVYLALKKQPSGNQASYPVQHSVQSEALSIAKSRLASGEITVEEFEQIKKNLL
ncbi:SHOCT domain-containing protein [Neobacillus sp. SM06]|uniref:SHOCT domain-containing protein n=1 Tax=Neobacillus sp. SM06 TaxID=3422492 RepID=UPI003D2672BC